MDFTYVANVAQAHVDAADKLSLESPVAGKAYFITNQVDIMFFLYDIYMLRDYEGRLLCCLHRILRIFGALWEIYWRDSDTNGQPSSELDCSL